MTHPADLRRQRWPGLCQTGASARRVAPRSPQRARARKKAREETGPPGPVLLLSARPLRTIRALRTFRALRAIGTFRALRAPRALRTIRAFRPHRTIGPLQPNRANGTLRSGGTFRSRRPRRSDRTFGPCRPLQRGRRVLRKRGRRGAQDAADRQQHRQSVDSSHRTHLHTSARQGSEPGLWMFGRRPRAFVNGVRVFPVLPVTSHPA